MSAGRQRLDRLKWGHVRAWIVTTAIIIVIIMVTVPQAQVSGPFSDERLATRIAADTRTINLRVGRSAVLDLESAITRVSLTTPEIADALVTSPNQVLIHGKTPGTISLFVWERMGAIRTYEVVVKRDLTALMGRMRQLFPGEPIAVADNGADVVISGTVSSKNVVEKAADVAAGYVESADHVVNLLRQQEGTASNQILLRVRFAEVNRSALQELGASFFTGILGHDNYLGRVTTQQFPAPEFDNEEGLVFSDFLNLLVFNSKEQLGGVIRALQTRGLFQSLAEPNLIAQDGKEASFLAGGEFPFPVVQGSGGANTAITIQFKEFGIRLSFTPTILMGDLIHLKVRPEVSALDFSNGLAIQGFRIPSLITRRADTEIELRDGQTFAIAGLLNSTVTETMSKIPGIGDIPILGLLFRSRARQKDRTELVVMITPHILRTGSIGAAPQLPDLAQPFLGPVDEPLPPPLPHVPQVGRFDREASVFDGAIEQAVDGAAADGTLAGPLLTRPSALAARPLQTGTGASWNGAADLNSEPFTPGDALRLDPDEAIRAAKERRRQEVAAEKLAGEQGKWDAQVAEEAAKQAERDAKVAAKLAREQAKLDAEAAKQAAKDAERQQKAAAQQAAQDRKDAASWRGSRRSLTPQRRSRRRRRPSGSRRPPRSRLRRTGRTPRSWRGSRRSLTPQRRSRRRRTPSGSRRPPRSRLRRTGRTPRSWRGSRRSLTPQWRSRRRRRPSGSRRPPRSRLRRTERTPSSWRGSRRSSTPQRRSRRRRRPKRSGGSRGCSPPGASSAR